MEKKKILVTFVEAGNGHKVTAQAVVDALKLLNADNVEIIASNLFANHKTLQKYEKFLINEVKKASSSPVHSNIQLASMHIIGSKNTLRFVNGCVFKRQRDLYIEQIKKINPDVIIDTHYFCSYCSVTYRNNFNNNCKVITYNPDNNVHGWWDRRVDKFVVNNNVAYQEAIKRGFSEEQLKQVFFLTREGILNANLTKEEYRERNGIPQNQFTVKLADGIYGQAKMKDFIYELIKIKKPLTIIAIAGKNKKLYNELIDLKNNLPSNITLLPFGFVSNIHELIKSSDLFITKGGPNAVLDGVLLEVPIIINYYANKIEKATKNLFIDHKECGLYIPNKKKARAFVEQCIENQSILNPYIKNEKKFDKSLNGGLQVAEFVLDVIK